MQTYTNVVFDRFEMQTLAKAADALSIAYPDVDRNPVVNGREAPKLGLSRLVELGHDSQARVVAALSNNRSTGTHERLVVALRCLQRLREVLNADIAYWSEQADTAPEIVPEIDSEIGAAGQRPARPIALIARPAQMARMLVDLRSRALQDTEDAIALLTNAVAVAKPLPDFSELADAC